MTVCAAMPQVGGGGAMLLRGPGPNNMRLCLKGLCAGAFNVGVLCMRPMCGTTAAVCDVFEHACMHVCCQRFAGFIPHPCWFCLLLPLSIPGFAVNGC